MCVTVCMYSENVRVCVSRCVLCVCVGVCVCVVRERSSVW